MKKEIVFIKYALSALLIVTSVTSCSDLLDTKPLGIATVGDLSTGGFEADAFGLYGQLRSTAASDWTRYWFQSIRSDDAAKGSTLQDAAQAGTDLNDFGDESDRLILFL